MKRRRAEVSADGLVVDDVIGDTQGDKSIIVEEDSGEAFGEPDASNSSIPSRAYMNQLLLRIQSLGNPVAASILPVQAQRRKTHVFVVSHTVAAVVHLWSLGVLTAAGCGIGSVHAVVRSNLLVEPSEVEEGEM
ncbi:hypothetical protein F511_35049 [Dorcoceras hygrometricum]|uniref:Uncharacterized protein n=1 Tax=Dorcoceras hygrometricum TaxID=472368 RepID=A0A2Z7AU07_9LAMI|nr:hypothetical protein F511_35049 [Dorcoceras hygrometricum]